MPERNEATVSWDVDIAEARPFVPTAADAFVAQTATWKSASVSLAGYYDDADFSIIDTAINNTKATLLVYPTRQQTTKYWKATVVINSLEHVINSEDYAELNVEASVDGKLEFIKP